jgi:hypothetical protein
MSAFFQFAMFLIGVAVVALLGAIFIRLGDLHNLQRADNRALFESLQHELTILWCAIVSDRKELAEQRTTFGYGPLFSWHESLAELQPWQRKKHRELTEHLSHLESTYWPPEEQAKKKIEIEEARLELRMNDASATEEERQKWDKIESARLDAEFPKKESK